MREGKLVMVIGGELTQSRMAHLTKLLDLIRKEFRRITIIHEGMKPTSVNQSNVVVKITGYMTAKPASPLVLKVYQHLLQEVRRIRIISKEIDQETILLFRGIYQPFSLIFARMLGGFALLFGGGFEYPTSSVRWALQMILLRMYSRIIFETPEVRRFYGLERFQGRSVCNGHLFVDTERFVPTKQLSDRKYDIGFIGALAKEKGIIPFIHAVCLLLEKREARVIIIGQGTLQRYVEQLIGDNRLGNLVELREHVKYSEMPDLYNEIKLLVVPSMSEGLPNVVIEAMACGTPVVASPVGGIPDVLEHMETGYLLDSIRSSEIGVQIEELLGNPELLEKISNEASTNITIELKLDASIRNWKESISNAQ